MKGPKLLDNKTNFVYEELFDSIKKGSKLSVVSASFTLNAYNKLKKSLNKSENMRCILTSPNFTEVDKKEAREYYIDNNNILDNYLEIKLKNEMTQSSISKDFSNWIREKVEIKSFKEKNKANSGSFYVDNGDDSSISIMGSVDFTAPALGFIDSPNEDFNACNYGDESLKTLIAQFELMWNNEDLLEDVKDKILDQTKLMYKENPAEFIYFLSLYNIFSNNLEELDEDNIITKGINLKETQIWNKLYKFQKDAAMGIIEKIDKHNGCILADSVGLGKTFTALAVIKYYELKNMRVLVLAPKKLRDNWTIYTQNDKRNIFVDDRFNFTVLNHTDLSREKGKSGDLDLKTLNWGNYDLVVIDESHNFRNNPSFKDRKTRYQKLMQDIIKEGPKTRVLMLSATPVNNKLTDIKNQIYFITEGNDLALKDAGIDSIENTLRKAQTAFNKWSKKTDEEKAGEVFIDTIDLDYFKLLDTLTIARSRKHIAKYYGLDEIGRFPKRREPINVKSKIDSADEFPPLKNINEEIARLNLGIYAPFKYIDPRKKKDYEKKYEISAGPASIFKQMDREKSLVQLMRINILKRMESSIESFRLTVNRLLNNIDRVLNKIDSGNIKYDPELDINLIDPEEEEYDEMMFGKGIKILFQDMDLISWRQDLQLDKNKLTNLLKEANKITPERDDKLHDLKDKIKDKIENPINKGNKKIIIFTAFTDTAKYLYENINQWAYEEFGLYSGLVNGSGSNKTNLKGVKSTDINDILINFSPLSKERASINPEARDEIDILICTDCISEGQNLQDCDYLINYDIHWNPVRIIQRFGRIDRIGSLNNEIQLVNFWPNMDLDEYIDLESRVKDKMVVVNVSATGEENIISKDQSMNDLRYRRIQLEELQNKVLDLEDIDNSISITDLTFNDFKSELRDYLKQNKKELEKAPNGIYSIVNIPEDLVDEIEPGVIFLLKQIKGTTESYEKNPLSPYYLVYIAEDGVVKFSYIKSKKVMDYYQKLCLGKTEILQDLVKDFNLDTDNGKDMSKYSSLLIETIEDIIGKKQEVGVRGLFSKGPTALVKNDVEGLEEFELITFLIVK